MIPQTSFPEQIKLPRATKAKSKKGTMGLQQVRSAGDIGMIEVDNPAEFAERRVHPKIWAERSLRDPLSKLHHTKRIDEAEYRAGRKMQALLEASEVGRLRSQDPSNEPVDGGGHMPDVMTDRQLIAIRTLQIIWAIVGQDAALLLRAVLSQGVMPERYGRRAGASGERDVSHYGWLFRTSLSRLVVHFGLGT